jgi:hypothetical protein
VLVFSRDLELSAAALAIVGLGLAAIFPFHDGAHARAPRAGVRGACHWRSGQRRDARCGLYPCRGEIFGA